MADRNNHTDEEALDTDPELDGQIRSHFAAARSSVEAPSFESLMARAEAADAVAAPVGMLTRLASRIDDWSLQTRWLGGAAMAAAAALTVLISIQSQDDRAAEEAALLAHHEQVRAAAEVQLLASLESTTRWRAPSDRWLAVETDIDIFGLPDIGTPEALKEKTTWL